MSISSFSRSYYKHGFSLQTDCLRVKKEKISQSRRDVSDLQRKTKRWISVMVWVFSLWKSTPSCFFSDAGSEWVKSPSWSSEGSWLICAPHTAPRHFQWKHIIKPPAWKEAAITTTKSLFHGRLIIFLKARRKFSSGAAASSRRPRLSGGSGSSSFVSNKMIIAVKQHEQFNPNSTFNS